MGSEDQRVSTGGRSSTISVERFWPPSSKTTQPSWPSGLCAPLLAGSDAIKFGYVSRVSPRDSSKHVILGTQQFKPQEFAAQITLDMSNCWGVLRAIIDICMKLDGGKYLILKDPNKPIMRLYSVPPDAFESEDDDDEEDDDGEDV